MPPLALAARHLLRIDEHGQRGCEAGQREAGRCGQQHKVALAQRDRRVPVDGEQATALQHDAEARVAVFGIAHGLLALATDDVGQDGARLQQPDDFGEGIAHASGLDGF